jgi:hypothetical protein
MYLLLTAPGFPVETRSDQVRCIMLAMRVLFLITGLGIWQAQIVSFAYGAEGVEFNRDIRPILAENCFSCHGPDSAARKAELRLDQRAAAIEQGAIVPGRPSESEAIRRVLSGNADERMPPPESHKALTADQKKLLERWVENGAEYQNHWSLITPRQSDCPKPKNSSWVRNPIDAFVLSSLERRGLTPAPEADRRTLARRLSLDLTGLPPTPELVENFVSDNSPDAYEKLVDRLLATPEWGEHRARYWLDVARYADTHGLHHDNFREIWTYRDWVINAFNGNMPFDRFTIEQLAGDLLPYNTPDQQLNQQIASGFNRCNITTSEGGAIPEEYLVLYTRDRTETVSQAWLGLTAGCAVCHDHKFDALSQREFYELAAFFNNTPQPAMDGNVKDTPPTVFVPLAEHRERWFALPEKLADVRRQLQRRMEQARPEFDAWAKTAKIDSAQIHVPSEGLALHAPLIETGAKTLDFHVKGKAHPMLAEGAQWEDGPIGTRALKVTPQVAVELPSVGDFERDQPFSCGAWIRFSQPDTTGAIVARMDDAADFRGWDLWVQDNRIGLHMVHKWPNNAIKVVATKQIKANEWHHVLATYDGSGHAEGIKIYYDGQLQQTEVQADKLKRSIRTTVPFKLAQRNATSRINDVCLQELCLYERALNNIEAQALASDQRAAILVAKSPSERSAKENDELYEWWFLKLDPTSLAMRANEISMQEEISAMRRAGTIAHVMQEKKDPAMAYFLHRGAYDKRGDAVTADTPDMLPPMPGDLPKNRLGFARWLFQPDQPLAARVTVNRFWQEIFGVGIVRTAGDFGVAGELPVNQELLDWLAVEFRESGWDVKPLFKLMVTSATYRQSAIATPEKLEIDPQNRLLSRGPRFRMDAEMVRDYALSASGLLVSKIGGPSVKPYQPPGVWEAVAMIDSNTRHYKQDPGESLYRRSLYTFWKRSAPPATMEVFNAPSREVCAMYRERTNTPLQALATLNDPQFVEAARHLAQTVLKSADGSDDRLQSLAQRLVSRQWRDEELSSIKSTLSDLSSYYAIHPDEAAKLVAVGESKADSTVNVAVLAAWTMLTNELMNLDEVLNK